MRQELSQAEQVLLSLLNGEQEHDLVHSFGELTEEIAFVSRLRSCTRYDYNLSEWVPMDNYNEVMGGQ